ncbi:MAG TPA: ribosomal protein S18-alanine N-acetyltransferase [Gemmatimonadaceae bacterium]
MTPAAPRASEATVRAATTADLDAVAAIEAATFSSPWSRRSFGYLVGADIADFLVAELGSVVAGYAVVYFGGDQSELANLAVAESYRRCGIGRLLLESAMARARARGAREMFLEVRASNHGAQELYASKGFRPVARRRAYYSDPVEDALVMRADLASVEPAARSGRGAR